MTVPSRYEGPPEACPHCKRIPGEGRVAVNVNSVIHWISFLEAGDPDANKIRSKEMRAIPRKCLAGYFAPMEFVGWHSITPQWVHRVSPLAKHNSQSYFFYAPEIENQDVVWGLSDLKAYFGTQPEFDSHPRVRAFFEQ